MTFWIDDETGEKVHLPANIREIMQDMADTESDDDDEDDAGNRPADLYIDVRF